MCIYALTIWSCLKSWFLCYFGLCPAIMPLMLMVLRFSFSNFLIPHHHHLSTRETQRLPAELYLQPFFPFMRQRLTKTLSGPGGAWTWNPPAPASHNAGITCVHHPCPDSNHLLFPWQSHPCPPMLCHRAVFKFCTAWRGRQLYYWAQVAIEHLKYEPHDEKPELLI